MASSSSRKAGLEPAARVAAPLPERRYMKATAKVDLQATTSQAKLLADEILTGACLASQAACTLNSNVLPKGSGYRKTTNGRVGQTDPQPHQSFSFATPRLPKPSIFRAKFATAKLRIRHSNEHCVLEGTR